MYLIYMCIVYRYGLLYLGTVSAPLGSAVALLCSAFALMCSAFAFKPLHCWRGCRLLGEISGLVLGFLDLLVYKEFAVVCTLAGGSAEYFDGLEQFSECSPESCNS